MFLRNNTLMYGALWLPTARWQDGSEEVLYVTSSEFMWRINLLAHVDVHGNGCAPPATSDADANDDDRISRLSSKPSKSQSGVRPYAAPKLRLCAVLGIRYPIIPSAPVPRFRCLTTHHRGSNSTFCQHVEHLSMASCDKISPQAYEACVKPQGLQ